ncbi:MAG: Gfo/Idh/MocA family oxidoreductase [Gemmatimonadetes bacterium]|nr:Gfo/Idh/MocA family oxidoreductase [Gemmatimonadota bacterium]
MTVPRTEPLAVGLIGLGNVALAHLEGYRQLTEIRVVAGADPRAERTTEMAARFGFRGYLDYQEMLERERLDLVSVLSTVATHPAAVIAAARRRLPVLCEKPLALTLADADLMIAACRSAGVPLFYAASYRFLEPVVKARELIQAGAIGEVRLLLETMIGTTGPSGYHDMGPHHYPPGGPGGSGNGLMDHGIHLVDVFGWLIGSEVESATGAGQISGEAPRPEHLTIRFRSGAVGHLIYDDATWPADLPAEGAFSWAPTWDEVAAGQGIGRGGIWQQHPGSIRVHGTLGSLRIFHYANQLFLRTARGIEQIRVADRPMPAQFAAELASFAASIRAGGPAAVPGEVGRAALATVLAAYSR